MNLVVWAWRCIPLRRMSLQRPSSIQVGWKGGCTISSCYPSCDICPHFVFCCFKHILVVICRFHCPAISLLRIYDSRLVTALDSYDGDITSLVWSQVDGNDRTFLFRSFTFVSCFGRIPHVGSRDFKLHTEYEVVVII